MALNYNRYKTVDAGYVINILPQEETKIRHVKDQANSNGKR